MGNQKSKLVEPHGGALKELIVDEKRSAELKSKLSELPTWGLTQRQVLDIELILNGAFSPLEGFLSKADYESVCSEMRLTDGALWPMPITLDVTEAFGSGLSPGDSLALRHPEGVIVAVLNIEDVWKPELAQEAETVFGTTDDTHPAVCYLFHQKNSLYVGGKLEGLTHPPHHTYKSLRHTPAELREFFNSKGWDKVVAFQTRNPLHRAHVELTLRAIKQAGANLLLHPVVGLTKPGDVDYFSRVRCYQAVIDNYPLPDAITLSLLPLAMRMAGPREALWHSIIRKNFGCEFFIVGRDHAGPGNDSKGEPFYGPYDSQELVREHEKELGITMVDFQLMVYVEDNQEYMPLTDVSEGMVVLNLSGTELREKLRTGQEIPEWFSYPQVIEELRRSQPQRNEQGFTVFISGLPGSGKAIISSIVAMMLLENGSRPVTLLDEEVIRDFVSRSADHSKAESIREVRRMGFIASEVTKNQGAVICAPTAPYGETRKAIRRLISQRGGFIEVYVSTPLEVCKELDRKGIYDRIESGEIKEYAGVTDGFEPVEDADLVIDTTETTPEEAAIAIYEHLIKEGYIDK